MAHSGASLNWVLLSATLQVVPLPGEKFLHESRPLTLTLSPTSPGTSLDPKAALASASGERKAKGRAHLSNLRCVFVAEDAMPSGSAAANTTTADRELGSLASGSASVVLSAADRARALGKDKIETVSVGWARFLDGRYVQPWFTAPYYEGVMQHVDGGGFSSPQLARFIFNESGGVDFYTIVEEMKQRVGSSSSREVPVEPLPLYTPESSSAPGAAQESTSPPPVDADDMLAAQVARDAERLEDGRPVPSTSPEAEADGRGGDAPPGYAP